MRVWTARAAAAGACLLPLLASGCLWAGAVDERSATDPGFPLVLLGILVLVGVVFLVLNLSGVGSDPPPPPALPPQQPRQWEQVQEFQSPARPSPPPRAPPAKPRRRAP